MRRKKDRHVLSHTLEHLLGVSVILGIAFTLGYIGKSMDVSDRAMLAQTSGSTYDPASYDSTLNSTTGSALPVSFSATRVDIACVSGVTKAKYRFSISPEMGGYIVLSTLTGPSYIDATNGAGMDRYLDVGGYSWSGSPRPGYMGTNYGMITVENVCTLTTDGTNSGPPPPPPPPPSSTTTSDGPTLVPVSFAAQQGPTSTCSPAGIPLTPVFLVATKPYGGSFLVSSDTGMQSAPHEMGEYYFPNGTYTWVAQVRSGYVGEGALSGAFTIAGTCSNSTGVTTEPSTNTTVTSSSTSNYTTSSPGATSVTSPLSTEVSPPLPRPLLSLFIENVPITVSRVFNKEQVEIRVTTADSVSVGVFTATGVSSPTLHGRAVKDDLLSRPGVDVWSYLFDMAKFPEGSVKFQARVKHSDGRETQTDPIGVSIAHPVAVNPPVYTSSLVYKESETIPPDLSDSGVQTSVHVSEQDRSQVLARISDPSSCTNKEECQIYCRSLPGVNELCASFARESVATRTPSALSLVDGLQEDALVTMLLGERPKGFPEIITRPEELKEYCSNSENFSACSNMLLRHDPSLDPTTLAKKRDEIEVSQKEDQQVFVLRTGTRAYFDSDQDGVTDYDEVNIYGTDPESIDSDRDGFADGAELLARTNPIGGVALEQPKEPQASTTTPPIITDESVAFYNPIFSGPTEPEILSVHAVEVAEIGKNAQGSTTATKLKLSGKAQPNSFVTLYIFSEPIVVTVKADATGAWVYTLDKELSDGTHQVYSAIADAGGRILAKSEPLPFVKVASAVTFGAEASGSAGNESGFFTGASLYAMIAILVGILGVALSIIGFIVRQKNDNEQGLPGI